MINTQKSADSKFPKSSETAGEAVVEDAAI
jgi:hypothetical protein